MSSVSIVPQSAAFCQTEPYQLNSSDRAEVLALADDCLERHNRARARFIVTGDPQALAQALALADDRLALLAEIGGTSWL